MEQISKVLSHLFALLPSIGFWDVVDIFLVAFIVYRSFLLIRGTRTVQILVAFGVLAIIYTVSIYVEARTTRALFGSIFDQLFIIFIVLFQQDIRRVLSQVGKTSFFSKSSAPQNAQLVEELVKSAISLSNKKIGALIVIEREADLSDFVESGVVVDSQVSKEVLTSIFLPVSPLHDGAVVIRKGRLAMAGCFLPLTLNTSVSKQLGTRHRAALGVTEETDSLCIVVSEESGAVGFASGGRIATNLDGAQLRKMLLETL